MLDLTKPVRPKVLVATPHTGMVNWNYTVAIEAVINCTRQSGRADIVPDETGFVFRHGCGGSNVADNQSILAEMAEDKGADYLFLVEQDNIPTHPETLINLLSHGKDVIGCTYPYKDPDLLAKRLAGERVPLRFMGAELDGTPITFRSLVAGAPVREVDFIPTGCALISVAALKAVREHRTRTYGGQLKLQDGARCCAFTYTEFYKPSFNADRSVPSTSDSVFCHDAHKAGFGIWLDAPMSLCMGHEGLANFMVPRAAWLAARSAQTLEAFEQALAALPDIDALDFVANAA